MQLVLHQNIHLGLVGPLSPNQAFETKSIGREKLWSIRQDSGIYIRSVNVLIGSNKMFLDMGYRARPNMLQTLFLTQPGERQHPGIQSTLTRSPLWLEIVSLPMLSASYWQRFTTLLLLDFQ